jgi:hypothetical protein
MQRGEHSTEAVKDAATLGALVSVMLHASSGSRRKLLVEELGHVAGGPAVIAPEAQAVPETAHRTFDPITVA